MNFWRNRQIFVSDYYDKVYITTKSTHVAGGSFLEFLPAFLKTFLAYPPPSAIEAFISLLLCVLCDDFGPRKGVG